MSDINASQDVDIDEWRDLGLLGQIAEFIYRSSPRPVKEIALAAALAFMSGITGRAYNISGTGLNQYYLMLAPTGSGKESMASGIDKLISAVSSSALNATKFVGPSDIASPQALTRYLSTKSQCFLSIVGEFGIRLQEMSAKNATASQQGLLRIMLQLYNKSGRTDIVQQTIYSDADKNTPIIEAPAFSVLGESTPEPFFAALSESMISNGLLPRFVVFNYNGLRPPLSKSFQNYKAKFDLINDLSTLINSCSALMSQKSALDVKTETSAEVLLDSFGVFCDEKINSSERDVVKHLWNRAHLKALKIAAVLAVGRNMYDPYISEADALWAGKVVYKEIAALSAKFLDGEVGGENIEFQQHSVIIEAIKFYISSSYEEIVGYGIHKKYHDRKVIPLSFIQRKVAKIAVFQRDRIKASQAVRAAMQSLVDQDIILEIPRVQAVNEFKSQGRLYLPKDRATFFGGVPAFFDD